MHFATYLALSEEKYIKLNCIASPVIPKKLLKKALQKYSHVTVPKIVKGNLTWL